MFGFFHSPPPPPPFFERHPLINDEIPCRHRNFSDCDRDFDDDDDDKNHHHRKTIGSQHHDQGTKYLHNLRHQKKKRINDQGTRYIRNAKKHPDSGPPYDQGSRYIENVQRHGRGLSQQIDP
jgi:hypothetical protein